MGGSEVHPEELHTHAANLRSIHGRFDAVKEASAHITGGDGAYGTLCRWVPAMLEDRHQAQDELIREVAFNIVSLAGAVSDCADEYEAADRQNASFFKAVNSSEMPPQ
jgi:hypothetical protein